MRYAMVADLAKLVTAEAGLRSDDFNVSFETRWRDPQRL